MRKIPYYNTYTKGKLLLFLFMLPLFLGIPYCLSYVQDFENGYAQEILIGVCIVVFIIRILIAQYKSKHIACPFCGMKEASLVQKENTASADLDIPNVPDSMNKIFNKLTRGSSRMHLQCRCCHEEAQTDILIYSHNGKRQYKKDRNFVPDEA